MRRTAALIVGGGPAGCAAAIALARAGIAPELVERSAAPRDVVCGGFLGWDALAALRRLGVDPQALGARPIGRLRLVAGSRTVEARLPRRAAGLSRRRLDEALIEAAAAAGAMVTRGRSVRAADPDRRTARFDDDEEVAAEALFLATGKHELRGLARSFGAIEPAVGLRAAIAPPPDLDDHIELHLFDEGYAGLLLQEGGAANLCLSVSKRRLAAAGGIAPLVAQLMREAPALADRIGALPPEWEAIAGVPYGWRSRDSAPGLFRIGDQSAVIASLAGDGIAIALTSGTAAAEALLRGGPDAAPSYQRRFAGRAARPLAVAGALRKAAEWRPTRPAIMMLANLPGLAGLAARLTRIG